MRIRRFAVAVAVVLASLAAQAQSVNFTGTWAGQIMESGTCTDTHQNINASGTGVVYATQTGSSVSGLALFILPDDPCNSSDTNTQTIVQPFSGTVNGSSVSFSFADNDGHPVNATLTSNGSSLDMTVTGSEFMVTGTLNNVGGAPDTSLSGTYVGTFDDTIIPCGTGSPLSYSGTITLVLTQFGSTLYGTGTVSNTKKDQQGPNGSCTVNDTGPGTASFEGHANGSSFQIFTNDAHQTEIDGTISGGVMTGHSVNPEHPGESGTFTATRTTTGIPAPSIAAFTADPTTISAGGSSVLSWSVVGASAVSIDHGVGTVGSSGTTTVSPSSTTTYTLTAAGIGGTSTATTLITVGAATAPHVAVSSFPKGMLEAPGHSGATDSFTLTNLGSMPANVSLSKNGSFFDISLSSFTLQPGATQPITLTASSEAAATYDGSVSVSGDGIANAIQVGVHLLVVGPPAGPVDPQPDVARVDVSAPGNQNPSGSVSFTNHGQAAVTAIAVASVPWIIPQTGPINIPAGQSATVNFTIDRTKRPDSNALAGGQTGAISLRFFGSASGSNMPVRAILESFQKVHPLTTDDDLGVSTVTASVIDVVSPNVTVGTPPPLSAGEVALFLAGHGSNSGVSGDLAIANRGTTPISGLSIYLASASEVAAVPQLAASAGISFPSIAKTVFAGAGNNLMIRGSGIANIATAALRVITAGGDAFTSAVPVFRSDGGVGPGGKIVLPGVENSSERSTLVFVQEMGGNSASVDLQGYAANGSPVGSKTTLSLTPFGASNDGGAATVAGAESVVITNKSGSSRINAFARIVDGQTDDSWVVTDPAATSGTSGALYVPLISTPTAAQSDIYVTNISSGSISASMIVSVPPSRHRAGRVQSQAIAEPESVSLTIAPLQTQKTTVAAVNGYVRIAAPAGSVSASGRVTMTNGSASFGSALPVLPDTAAIGTGSIKRFANVYDAAPATIANRTVATYRPSLMLLETSGHSAVVHVSIWFSYAAGTLVSAQSIAPVTADFGIDPNQMLVIPDLARAVIGSARDSYGDLSDMQVEVSISSGSGHVIPLIQSVDNGSGDVVMRTE